MVNRAKLLKIYSKFLLIFRPFSLDHPLDSLNTIRKKLRDWFGRKWAKTWNIIWKISSRFSICSLISSNNISSILESPLREGEKPSSTGLTITVLACNRIPGARYSPSPSSFPRRTWTSCYTLGLRVNLVSVRIIVSRLDDCYGMVTREDVSPFVVVKKGYKLIHGIWVALIEVGVPSLLPFCISVLQFPFEKDWTYFCFCIHPYFPGVELYFQ